jgi:hypothetical protein
MTEQFWNLHDHEYVFVEEGTMFEKEVGDIVLCVHSHELINRRQTPQYAAIIQPPDTIFFLQLMHPPIRVESNETGALVGRAGYVSRSR